MLNIKTPLLAIFLIICVVFTIVVGWQWWSYQRYSATPISLDLNTELNQVTVGSPDVSISTEPASAAVMAPKLSINNPAKNESGDISPNKLIPSNTTEIPRLTGPGVYACDPEGICRHYGDEMRTQKCAVTFADSLCLDSCSTVSKRCQL